MICQLKRLIEETYFGSILQTSFDTALPFRVEHIISPKEMTIFAAAVRSQRPYVRMALLAMLLGSERSGPYLAALLQVIEEKIRAELNA